MRSRTFLRMLLCMALLASCQKKADPLLGKWLAAEGGGWVEYFADGDVLLNDGVKSVSGTWKRLEDGRIKVNLLVKGSSAIEVYQVAVRDGAAVFTSSSGTVRVYQRPDVAASADGALAALSEISPLRAKDMEAQRKTVADIRLTGTAMFSWLTDQVGAAAAGQSQRERNGRWNDIRKYTAISHDELERILVPQYAKSVPEIDGWGYRYEYYLNPGNPLAPQIMSIRSPGRDGVFSGSDYTIEPFEPDDFYEDIVWSDGFFVRWPQKKKLPGE